MNPIFSYKKEKAMQTWKNSTQEYLPCLPIQFRWLVKDDSQLVCLAGKWQTRIHGFYSSTIEDQRRKQKRSAITRVYLSNSEVLGNLVGCLGAKCPGGEE